MNGKVYVLLVLGFIFTEIKFKDILVVQREVVGKPDEDLLGFEGALVGICEEDVKVERGRRRTLHARRKRQPRSNLPHDRLVLSLY